MVAIRMCARCKTEFDAVVGEDGIYCSATCGYHAAAEKKQKALETGSTPKGVADGEFFDDLPAMADEEIELAIARLNRRRRIPAWM